MSIAVEAAESGADLIAAGEMGIGNTTASSAITAAFTGASPEETTGAGTGRNAEELAHKASVVRRALEVNAPDPSDGLDVLSKVGGFEIGVLGGRGTWRGEHAARASSWTASYPGRQCSSPGHLCPIARDYMIASHRSAERGHGIVLSHLKLLPLLELDMRLGEGSGAVLAMPIVLRRQRHA